MVAIDKAGQSVDLSVDDGIWRLHNSAAALALECAQPWCAELRPCVDLRSGPGLGERFWGPLPEKG